MTSWLVGFISEITKHLLLLIPELEVINRHMELKEAATFENLF